MGNTCCNDDRDQQLKQSTRVGYNNKANENQRDAQNFNQNQIYQNSHYFDADGKPKQNAYRTYVKPPTTIGRQTHLMNHFQNNNEVPDQIWDFDDNILRSTKKRKNRQGLQNIPLSKNRTTYQEIIRPFNHLQISNNGTNIRFKSRMSHRQTHQNQYINQTNPPNNAQLFTSFQSNTPKNTIHQSLTSESALKQNKLNIKRTDSIAENQGSYPFNEITQALNLNLTGTSLSSSKMASNRPNQFKRQNEVLNMTVRRLPFNQNLQPQQNYRNQQNIQSHLIQKFSINKSPRFQSNY